MHEWQFANPISSTVRQNFRPGMCDPTCCIVVERAEWLRGTLFIFRMVWSSGQGQLLPDDCN